MRIILFLILVCVLVWTSFPVFLVSATLYSVRYRAYELIALGVLADHAYGVTSFTLPLPLYYTSALCIIVLFGIWLHPYILSRRQTV